LITTTRSSYDAKACVTVVYAQLVNASQTLPYVCLVLKKIYDYDYTRYKEFWSTSNVVVNQLQLMTQRTRSAENYTD